MRDCTLTRDGGANTSASIGQRPQRSKRHDEHACQHGTRTPSCTTGFLSATAALFVGLSLAQRSRSTLRTTRQLPQKVLVREGPDARPPGDGLATQGVPALDSATGRRKYRSVVDTHKTLRDAGRNEADFGRLFVGRPRWKLGWRRDTTVWRSQCFGCSGVVGTA
jgi:hypothetical protein